MIQKTFFRTFVLLVALSSSCVFASEIQPATTIILTRHGETQWNVEKRWQGATDIPLNLTGIKQATEKSELYSDYPIAAVYSSALQRAHLTAQIIAAPHGHRVRILDGLTEPSFGILDGMTKSEIMELIGPRLSKMSQEERRHSGELEGLVTPATIAKKAEDALRMVGQAHPGQMVVAVAHSGIIEPILVMHTDTVSLTVHMTNMAYLKFIYDG